MKQFVPFEGLYAYARYDSSRTILAIFNNNEKKTMQLNQSRFKEVLKDFSSALDII